jgi:hypothetical protein
MLLIQIEADRERAFIIQKDQIPGNVHLPMAEDPNGRGIFENNRAISSNSCENQGNKPGDQEIEKETKGNTSNICLYQNRKTKFK